MFETVLAHMYKQWLKTIKSPADWGWILIYPIIGIVSIGLLGLYFRSDSNGMTALIFIVIGNTIWNVYGISQKAVTHGLAYDLWDECIKHTHLGKSKDEDFIAGNCIFGILTSIAGVVVLAAVSWLLFGVNIFSAGAYLFGAIITVSIYAFSIGLMIDSMILRRGYDWMSLVWISTGIVMILSGVYYPVEILPQPILTIAQLTPATHSINSVRAAMGVSSLDAGMEFLYSLLLSAAYFVASYILYKKSMDMARKKGSLSWL
jgi:ABC-2 type transport system permease protein